MKPTFDYSGAVSQFKAEILRRTLAQMKGNQSAAARLLGIHRNALERQMKALGVESLPFGRRKQC